MLCENRDVLPAFHQGREPQHQHVETIIQVGAKFAGEDAVRQRRVRSGYDPNVGFERSPRAQRPVLPVLQNAQ
jgi:hypothetical protein